MSDAALGVMNVLLVDDDDYQRKLLHKMLTVVGVGNVHHAADAKSALDMTAQLADRLDVVISDLDMPGIDGMEFLRLLADQKITASVLILSSKHQSILRSVNLMAKEYGLQMLGALPKPASIDMLKNCLTGFVQQPRRTALVRAADIAVEDIRSGMDADQFEPFFQPKVDLRTRRIRGMEALARWCHPERGILPPGLFIDAMERNGMIDDLAWRMLDKSAIWLHEWGTAGLDFHVSINFSQASLTNVHVYDRIMEVISRHQLLPERFVIEVTESTAMTDIAHALECLSRLRMKGFGLSIDDFGTGHSSFQQLSRVPFSELKVDQAFVTGAMRQPHLRAVQESSIGMAKKFGLISVGEGIETQEDWDCLQQSGCDLGQGYFIAKPMEGTRFMGWAKAWNKSLS